MELIDWEDRFRKALINLDCFDSAHDLGHVERVVENCKKLAPAEKAQTKILLPAAWFHDCVLVSKESPDRPKASLLAAEKTIEILSELEYDRQLFDEIGHAIEAHSFSAQIVPESIEAKVLQDADRLDAIGAIGLARCLAVGTDLQRELYCRDDPFCAKRDPDDTCYIVDHFFAKLLKITDKMQTEAGQKEAQRRTAFLSSFLEQLQSEIDGLPTIS